MQQLPADQPVYRLQSHALFEASWLDPSIEEMDQHYTEAIRLLRAGRIGCWGGPWEESSGERVEFLGLIDATYCEDEAAAERHDRAAEYIDQFTWLFRQPSPSEQHIALHREQSVQAPAAQLRHLLQSAKAHAAFDGHVDLEEVELQVQVREGSSRLISQYRVQRVKAGAHVWWAEDRLSSHGTENGTPQVMPVDWTKVVGGGVSECVLSGDHWSLLKSPALRTALAQRLDSLSRVADERKIGVAMTL